MTPRQRHAQVAVLLAATRQRTALLEELDGVVGALWRTRMELIRHVRASLRQRLPPMCRLEPEAYAHEVHGLVWTALDALEAEASECAMLETQRNRDIGIVFQYRKTLNEAREKLRCRDIAPERDRQRQSSLAYVSCLASATSKLWDLLALVRQNREEYRSHPLLRYLRRVGWRTDRYEATPLTRWVDAATAKRVGFERCEAESAQLDMQELSILGHLQRLSHAQAKATCDLEESSEALEVQRAFAAYEEARARAGSTAANLAQSRQGVHAAQARILSLLVLRSAGIGEDSQRQTLWTEAYCLHTALARHHEELIAQEERLLEQVDASTERCFAADWALRISKARPLSLQAQTSPQPMFDALRRIEQIQENVSANQGYTIAALKPTAFADPTRVNEESHSVIALA